MRAETTFRIEMLKYYEDLFPDASGFRDTSGWKCLFAKNYKSEITKKDIKWFINETVSRISKNKMDSDEVEKIVDVLYNRYKFTIDNLGVAILIKSKTEIIRDKKSFISRMFSSIRNGFKLRYNKTLELMKI